MAPFLRASLHGLRSSLRLQQESCHLKLSGSLYSKQRWYTENAVLEDSTQTVNDADSEKGAASKGSDPAETVGEVVKHGAAKETGREAVPDAATDKLTSLILGKMRSKNSSSASRDTVSVAPEAVSAFSKVSKPSEERKEPVKLDKWDQVMVSMRNMAVKRREVSGNARATSGMKPMPLKSDASVNDDDFADLDLPSGPLSKALINSEKLPSTDEAFKSFLSSSKQRDGGKQKVKEAKAVSFSFLKALDSEPTPSKATTSEVESRFGSSFRAKDNGFLQSTRKETKPNMWDTVHHSSDVLGLNNENVADVKRKLDNVKPMKSSNSGHMVCVQNVSSQNDFALVKEALSSHGEVVSSYKEPNANGSFSAFIEFKTAEAMDDALAARWVRIDSKAYGVVRVAAPSTTIVRLSKVDASTMDSQVHTMCEKFGVVDIVRRRGPGFYDVYFKAGELSNMSTILDRLNEVTLNNSRWTAQPAPLLHPALRRDTLKSSEGQAWHALQLNQTLSKIETGLNAVSLSFEDLKSLIAMEDELAK